MLKSLILLELIYACWETRIYPITLCVETQVSSIICRRCSLFSSVDFCYLKVLNVFSHQRNENWNYFKIPPHPSQNGYHKEYKMQQTRLDVGGGEFLDNIDKSVNLAVIWKSGWRLFKKTGMAIWRSYPTPGDTVKGLSILLWRHWGIMFIASLFTIARK